MNKKINFSNLSISIFLIWLFHISGIIGILLGYEKWFVSLTYVNLCICFFAILINEYQDNIIKLVYLLIPFFVGLFAEWLGVNYGLVFGNYSYGNNLGFKLQGVPIMIGVNWVILVYATALLSKSITKKVWLSATIASIIMLLLDFFMEIVAPRFDFWMFEKNQVPIKNYIGWFLVGLIAQLLFQQYFKTAKIKLATHILLAFFLFFILFAIQTKAL
jgi:bisanhydrobacterioruberin hydratase